jgi:tRNA A-37 threonylcarbamoyl transferase component Bud32
MVTEYLEGETVDEILQRIAADKQVGKDEGEAIRLCGTNLAKVHQAGFALIDSQPINCIWVPGERKVYLTDFEYCSREDKRIWDVGFFLCFLALRVAGNLKNQVKQIFLESYQKEEPLNLAAMEQMSQEWIEYLALMQVILDIRQFTAEELFEELLNPR